MIALSVIRPDDWNIALFVHLLGAFTLIGALVIAAGYLFAARRDGSLALTRAGFRSLLIVALPSLIVTRIAAQWIASEENLDDSEATWIETGYASTDVGFLLLVVATVAAGLAIRRAGRDQGAGGGGTALAAWLASILVVVYAVVVWLMATKPA